MITDAQLNGFRTMHAAFRVEFGRLAAAFAAPRDRAHVLLLEEQLKLALEVLHAHHTHEDDNVWPFLISCAPGSKRELDELEAEHEELDPLITGSADRSRTFAERADSLHHLHEFLNQHIDHEERIAFPLMREHLTPEDIEKDRRTVMALFGRRRVPVMFGWIASCLDDELFASALGENPRVVRLLFRKFWWPAYQRRFVSLYGGDAVLPAQVLTLAGVR